MKSVIDVSGEASKVQVTVILPQKYTMRNGDDYSINLSKVTSDGYDVAVSVAGLTDCDLFIGSGAEASVDVKLWNKWQKHNLKSNVKINTYCTKGVFASALALLMEYYRIIGMAKGK